MTALRWLIAAGVALVVLGSVWLLDALGVLEAFAWLWPLTLALAGVLVVILMGLDKGTAVIAPFLLAWAALTVAWRQELLSWTAGAAVLVILFGLLLLAAPLLPLPRPVWLLGGEPRR